MLHITERTAFGIVTDLTEAGYVVKDKDGRRNRYRIHDHLPLPQAVGRERTIGEALDLLIDTPAPDSAQPPDGNAGSNGPAPTRPRRWPQRDPKSPPPSDVRDPQPASSGQPLNIMKIGDSERLVTQVDVTSLEARFTSSVNGEVRPAVIPRRLIRVVKSGIVSGREQSEAASSRLESILEHPSVR